jgi:hypothetical protein
MLSAAACSLLVTLGARHLSLTPLQNQLLSNTLMRAPLFLAIAYLATHSWSLSVSIAFLTWLILDVALDERRSINLVVGGTEWGRRAQTYARNKQSFDWKATR